MYWNLVGRNSHDILQQDRQACIENKWGKIAITFTAKSASMYWELLEENSHDILQQNRRACIENKWGKIVMTLYNKIGKHVLRTSGGK